ncbi:MAG: transcription termination/antitermination protein NusA [Ruminococcus sp.]|nr:transcription termination/antitermination protein NusA [Ruminococcus sp.]
MVNKELFEALALLEKEKGIPVEYMIDQIKRAIIVACKNLYGNENVDIVMDSDKNTFTVKLIKMVVEEVENESYEISLEDAKLISKRAAVGKEIGIPLDPRKFGRIAVSASKNVIHGGIRDGEKGQVLREFQSKYKEILTATVERIDPKTGNATLKFGKAEAVLPKSEQIGEEELCEGDKVKVYVVDVKVGDRGPKAIISRTHPDFVRKMFETEVPEIFDGIVEIKSISREAGSRTKMAVISNDPEIDAVGSCIGTRGARVNTIVEELGGEKIDIIVYDEDPEKYIAASLAPATVVKVELAEDGTKSCKVTVPDGQLSLAIGNKGQNARLAAKLTGWKIDIRPESGFFGEDTED